MTSCNRLEFCGHFSPCNRGRNGYGPELNRFGPGFDEFTPECNKFGHGPHELGAESRHSKLEENNFGTASDKCGSEQSKFGPRHNEFGPEPNNCGPGPNKFGPDFNQFGPEHKKSGKRGFGPFEPEQFPVGFGPLAFGLGPFGYGPLAFGIGPLAYGPTPPGFGPGYPGFSSNPRDFNSEFFSGQQRPDGFKGPTQDGKHGFFERRGQTQFGFGRNISPCDGFRRFWSRDLQGGELNPHNFDFEKFREECSHLNREELISIIEALATETQQSSSELPQDEPSTTDDTLDKEK